MVAVGDKIPSVILNENSPDTKIDISEVCSGKKVVIFGVPGAFTPGCSKTHLPGYVEAAEDLKGEGVEEIVCVAVNDPFVMKAWGQQHGAEGKVRRGVYRGSSLYVYRCACSLILVVT
jgi:2-Cys peroxiredoxin 5